MAKQAGKVYLGYEDEAVSEKNQRHLCHSVNKIGGFPDWPPLQNIKFPSKCPICSLHRMLVIQCYAPLENSIFHRTLYVFACINPNCWTQSESWICLRSQIQDEITTGNNCIKVDMPKTETNWCTGADEWDENDNGDSANGNFMSVDNAPSPNNTQRFSDEDDESNSFEVETMEQAFGNLHVKDAHNANMSPIQGAVGAIGGPVAAAELEGGDEPGLVTVDTPTAPASDLDALLHQNAELPPDLRSRLQLGSLQFAPKFIYVEEELKRPSNNYHDDKVTELLNKYRRENEVESIAGGDKAGGDDEAYEEATPLHGDRLFHAFVTRIRENPGQLLRYSREEPPILGAPLPTSSPDFAPPTVCNRCGSRLICELQLLPNLADCLRTLPALVTPSHLHFLSVLIFTCAQSCWQTGDTVVEETVVFQPEI